MGTIIKTKQTQIDLVWAEYNNDLKRFTGEFLSRSIKKRPQSSVGYSWMVWKKAKLIIEEEKILVE